ncbi:MAG: hypothetical protein ACK4YQ_13350 [Phenylobacterium sp.]|uniref:hypothetical protein n=1 Tax=Phenylobacterium sp. TaxID=1871053 RepID=UPI003918EFF9
MTYRSLILAADAAHAAGDVRVLAGDLLSVDGRRVRVANARAPALPPDARCWGEAALAVQSAARTEALIAEAGGVKLTPEGEGADGVALARVALGGRRDLGEALIFQGLAARRSQTDWDWCGAPDFDRADGPGFGRGPQANAQFMAWIAAEQDRQMRRSLARLMWESGSSLESFDGS